MSLEHPLLRACGVRHAFGTRADPPPRGVLRPRQVHGARVVNAGDLAPGTEADAVVDRSGRAPIAVATADCVPVLASAEDGSAVAAIHAGWRGLAAGVVEAGIDALRREAGGRALRAVVGPHIGPCCYEVDAPVLDALRHRFASDLEAAIALARPGHWWLDLAALTRRALQRAGLSEAAIGGFRADCTACDASRFHSYRRDGPRSGRLVHWISVHLA